jgi:uncharacterized protein DUF4236
MGLRFSRRVTLFPGVRLNFSRSGVSASIGPRGASVTIGPHGSAVNLGIPGTGLSFRQQLGPIPSSPRPEHALPESAVAPPPASLATPIESAPVAEVTSDGLQGLKDLILKVRAEREQLRRAIAQAQYDLTELERRLRRAKHWLWGLFIRRQIPQREAAVGAKSATVKELQERLEGSYIETEFALDDATRTAFEKLTDAFVIVMGCERIWDVTTTEMTDRYRTRSAASTTIDRRPVQFSIIEQDEILETSAKILRLQNANGADLNVYPGFLLMHRGPNLALVDLRDITLEFAPSRFIETERVPSDSSVVDQVWFKSNKDGSRDQRFAGNYQIPVAQYVKLHLASPSGLREEYMFSSVDKSRRFVECFSEYQAALRALGDKIPGPQAPAAAPELPEPSQAAQPAVNQMKLRSVDFLKVRSAASVDDAVKTVTSFVHMLKSDVESLSGQSVQFTTLQGLVASLGGVVPTLRTFFVRSPAAKAAEPIAIREVSKMLRGVLGQIESAVATNTEAEAQRLLTAVRQTSARLE